jgi:hypothetical protein
MAFAPPIATAISAKAQQKLPPLNTRLRDRVVSEATHVATERSAEEARLAPAASFSFARLAIAAPGSTVGVSPADGQVAFGRTDREAGRTAGQALDGPAAQALLDATSSGYTPIAHLQEGASTAARIRLRTPPGSLSNFAIGPVDDEFEQEADRVADEVMRMATPPAADNGPAIRSAGPRIQRKCEACGADNDEPCTCVQRKAESASPAVIRSDAPSALRGGGQPLSSRERQFFEPRFGADFSRVRIHSDAAAAEMAQSLRARAFTTGGHIVFGAGRFTPETQDGRRLLAHELTHVVQQQRRPHAIQREAEPAADPRIVVTPTKQGVNITITADTKLEGGEVYVLTVMYGKRVSRERAVKLIESGEEVGCVAPVCKTGLQPGETIDLFFGPDQRQEENVQAPKRKLPPEVQNALESGYMRIFMLDRQTQKHLELPAQPDFSEDRAVIMARNALLTFSRDDVACFWKWLSGEKIEGWWNLAYRLGQFLEVRPNVCAPVDITPLGRLSGYEDLYALIKEAEKLEKQTYTYAGMHDRELHEKLDAAKAARDKALRDADFSDVDAFDTAANTFRVYFRKVAVAVLEHSLDQSEHVLRDAVGRYQTGSNPNIKPGNQINPVAQQLYDELYRLPNSQGRSLDQLKIDHPILQGATVWDKISRAGNVLDFSNALTLYAIERVNIDLPMVRNALGRSEDVVFKFDPIVKATMERVGVAQGSIFDSVIQDQRGKPGEPWWQTVLNVGLLLLSFVPGPIGIMARTVSAIRDIGTAATNYGEQFSAYELGYQEKPSVAPIAVAVGVNVLPGAAVSVVGKGVQAVKALRATSSLETAAARTAASDIIKTEAGDVIKTEAGGVARTEGDVLATDLAKTEGEAAKDVAKTGGEAAKDVGKTGGEAAKDVAKTEGEAAKDVAKTEGEATKDVAKAEGEAAKDVAKTEGAPRQDAPHEEPSAKSKPEGEVPPSGEHGGPGPGGGSPFTASELHQQAEKIRGDLEEAEREWADAQNRYHDIDEKLEEFASRKKPPSQARMDELRDELAKAEIEKVEKQKVRDELKGALAEVESELDKITRPSWRQSEIDVGRQLGSGYSPQRAYRNGVEVSPTTEGSVRPDWVKNDGSVAVEVKNYDIANNSQKLIDVVSDQAKERARHLPAAMKQELWIDIRGQVVSAAQENEIIKAIVEKSGGAISQDDIDFMREVTTK